MNHNIIYAAIGNFWKLHSNSDVFNTIFDSIGAAAVEARLSLDQVNDSLSIEKCPVFFEKTWLYRKPERWYDTGGFHQHYFEEFISTGQTAFNFSVPLKDIDIFYNGQKLNAEDDFITTSTGITFPYTVPAGAAVSVYGHRILEVLFTTTYVEYTGVINPLSVEFNLSTWDITALTVFTGTTITIKSGTFYKGENLRIVEGALTEDVFVSANNTQVVVAGAYTAPTIYRVLDMKIPKDSARLVDGDVVEFDELLPAGIYFRISDDLGGETITVTQRAQSFKANRAYNENTYVITILGGAITTTALTISASGASIVSMLTGFNPNVNAVIYAEYVDEHTHLKYSETVVVATSRITIDFDVETDQPHKVFVNGLILDSREYRWLSTRMIEFWDHISGMAYSVQPSDKISVFASSSTAYRYHLHVRNEFVVQTSERSFDLTHHGSPETFPAETYIGGQLEDSYFTDDDSMINFVQTVSSGHRIYVDIPALDYPYYTEVDDDIDNSYYTDTGIPRSFLYKAEEIRTGILSGSSEPWVEPTTVPTDEGFTIRFIQEPAYVRLLSFNNMEEVWFKDAYVVEYTVYDVFGIVFDLPLTNSQAFKSSVMALMEGMWKGSQLYTIDNFANIIFGSDFTLTQGEVLTSRAGDTVQTTGSTYSSPDDLPFRMKPVFNKHHAFTEYFKHVDPGDYLALFAQNHSSDYQLSNTLDEMVDTTIEGTMTSLTQNTLGYYIIEDTTVDFTLGPDGEVWVGDRIYFKHVSGTTTIEYYSVVIEVVDQHTLVVDPATDYMSYYKHASISSNIYRIYARKTSRMNSGQHLDQAYDVTTINTALGGVLPFMNTYELALPCLLGESTAQKMCKTFLTNIVPAFSAYEVYTDVGIDEGDLTDLASAIKADVLSGADTIAFIDIGNGGDAEPISKADTGQRVAPVSTETSIRSRISRLNIDWVQDMTTYKNFIAATNPQQLNDRPFNEVALIANSGRMLAHWVFERTSNGRAKKYTKTDLLWLIYTWKMTGV